MATGRRSLPLLEEPLDPALTTLNDYAGRHGVSLGYIQSYWMPRPRFPRPVGRLPGRGRNGGGPPRKVYLEQAIDDFRSGEPDLQPRTVAKIVTDLDLGDEVTLGHFADHSQWESGERPAHKTITQYRGMPGFPAPVRPTGRSTLQRYVVRELVKFFNSRPGRKAPSGRPDPARVP